ncbi:hypothetical protein [Okeania sp. SIO1I7]|uniref:hypothetical protein n=1 Tax=Okeania sp. SIO1I7 TaxID=2607772 RepID=UPI0013F83877|nr:hypothetical protein [Okeania sp. SIO1I7]NET29446.1 hypothetical protein [Okeania sp. SIO1I7]
MESLLVGVGVRSQPTPNPSQPTPNPSQEGRGSQKKWELYEEVVGKIVRVIFMP